MCRGKLQVTAPHPAEDALQQMRHLVQGFVSHDATAAAACAAYFDASARMMEDARAARDMSCYLQVRMVIIINEKTRSSFLLFAFAC